MTQTISNLYLPFRSFFPSTYIPQNRDPPSPKFPVSWALYSISHHSIPKLITKPTNRPQQKSWLPPKQSIYEATHEPIPDTLPPQHQTDQSTTPPSYKYPTSWPATSTHETQHQPTNPRHPPPHSPAARPTAHHPHLNPATSKPSS